MGDGSDSDIEMILPAKSSQAIPRAASASSARPPILQNNPRPTALPPLQQSSSLPIIPSTSLAATYDDEQQYSGGPRMPAKGSVPAGKVISIDSDDDEEVDDRTVHPSCSHLPGRNSIASRTTSAPSNLFGASGRSKGKQRAIPDSDSDDLPDIGIGAAKPPRNAFISSDARRARVASRRGGSRSPSSTPPPPVFNPFASQLNARSSSPPSLGVSLAKRGPVWEEEGQEEEEVDDDATPPPPTRKKTKTASSRASPESGRDATPPVTASITVVPALSKTKMKEIEREEKKAAKAKEKAEQAVSHARQDECVAIRPTHMLMKSRQCCQAINAAQKENANKMKAANNKLTRESSCPEISMDVSTTLLSDAHFMDKVFVDLHARLDAIGVAHSTAENGRGRKPDPACHPKIIHWKRTVKKDWDPTYKHWKPREIIDYTVEEEKTVLIYLDANDVERAILAGRGVVDRKASPSASQSLIEIVSSARRAHGPDYQVFLLVQNLSERQKASDRVKNAEWRASVQGASASSRSKEYQAPDIKVSTDDIEMDLVRVTVAERCHVVRSEKYSETVDWLVEFTKDISFRPYK